MELRPEGLPRRLAGEPLRPAYLVAGAEPLLVQECADAIRAKAREEGYGEREVLDAEGDFDWNRLLQAGASLSLFASRRLLDLRIPSGKPGKEGAPALLEYLANPPPDTVLLVTGHDWSKAHAGKWSERIAEVGHLVAVWPLKRHELPDWLQQRLRRHGLAATPDALEALVQRTEGNLLAAAQEIEKLALLLGRSGGGDGLLDADRLQALVADAARYDVFGLVEAALQGETARVPRILAALRAEGDHVAGLLPWTTGELMKVAAFAAVQANGGNVQAAMREARVWESRMAVYKRAVDRHPLSHWSRFLAEAGEIERLAKGRGVGDAWLRLERLLLAVAQRQAAALLPG